MEQEEAANNQTDIHISLFQDSVIACDCQYHMGCIASALLVLLTWNLCALLSTVDSSQVSDDISVTLGYINNFWQHTGWAALQLNLR